MTSGVALERPSGTAFEWPGARAKVTALNLFAAIRPALRFASRCCQLCRHDDKHRKVEMNISATITAIAKRVTFFAAAALRLSLFSDGASL